VKKVKLYKTGKGFTGYTQMLDSIAKTYEIDVPTADKLLCNAMFDYDVIVKILERIDELINENEKGENFYD
jgi:hypothetical protein